MGYIAFCFCNDQPEIFTSVFFLRNRIDNDISLSDEHLDRSTGALARAKRRRSSLAMAVASVGSGAGPDKGVGEDVEDTERMANTLFKGNNK